MATVKGRLVATVELNHQSTEPFVFSLLAGSEIPSFNVFGHQILSYIVKFCAILADEPHSPRLQRPARPC
jgi:hypothetical protein